MRRFLRIGLQLNNLLLLTEQRLHILKQLYTTAESTDESELIQLLLKRQAELNSLLEVTQAINKNSATSTLFQMLDLILKGHLKIGKMRLLIKEGEHFYCASKFGGDFETPHELQLICQLLQQIDTIGELRSHPNELINQYDYFVPVVHEDQHLAYVLIGDLDTRPELINNDLNFIQTLINVIVVALENKKLFNERVHRERLQRDMQLASEVQTMLVPQRLPKNGTVEVGATYRPNQNIGGDYYDFIRLNPHQFMWCIADVSGKGVSAALLMANLQASLRAWASVETDLARIIQKLNTIVFSNTNGDRFITVFLGRYDERTRQLEYVNAGHNTPVLITNNQVKFLNQGTTVIGVFEQLPAINTGYEVLETGSLIFNYTDGLVESADEDIFITEEELLEGILAHKHLPVDELNHNVLLGIQESKNAQMNSDDVTLLAIKILS